MHCPFKYGGGVIIIESEYYKCEREKCAWWNERFGMCAMAVDAHLKAREDRRLEREINKALDKN